MARDIQRIRRDNPRISRYDYLACCHSQNRAMPDNVATGNLAHWLGVVATARGSKLNQEIAIIASYSMAQSSAWIAVSAIVSAIAWRSRVSIRSASLLCASATSAIFPRAEIAPQPDPLPARGEAV